MEPDLNQIIEVMDQRYRDGDPYAVTLPWDEDRTRRIYKTVCELVLRPGYRQVAVRKLGRILDVGCGIGSFPEQMNLLPDERPNYLGIDLSREALKKATERNPNLLFQLCPVEKFQSERRFDTVVSVESIEHWADAKLGLKNIYDHLEWGGIFVLTTPNADSLHHRIGRKLRVHTPFCSDEHTHEFGYEELRSLLRETGFAIIQSKGICLAPYWALESEFGTRIRKLTDSDPEVVEWLGQLGEACPELAFIQVHACIKARDVA